MISSFIIVKFITAILMLSVTVQSSLVSYFLPSYGVSEAPGVSPVFTSPPENHKHTTDLKISPNDLQEFAIKSLGLSNERFKNLPTLSELTLLLGKTSQQETLELIRNLASTDDGRNLIKSFLTDYQSNLEFNDDLAINLAAQSTSQVEQFIDRTDTNLRILQPALPKLSETTSNPGLWERLKSWLPFFAPTPNVPIPYSAYNIENTNANSFAGEKELLNPLPAYSYPALISSSGQNHYQWNKNRRTSLVQPETPIRFYPQQQPEDQHKYTHNQKKHKYEQQQQAQHNKQLQDINQNKPQSSDHQRDRASHENLQQKLQPIPESLEPQHNPELQRLQTRRPEELQEQNQYKKTKQQQPKQNHQLQQEQEQDSKSTNLRLSTEKDTVVVSNTQQYPLQIDVEPLLEDSKISAHSISVATDPKQDTETSQNEFNNIKNEASLAYEQQKIEESGTKQVPQRAAGFQTYATGKIHRINLTALDELPFLKKE